LDAYLLPPAGGEARTPAQRRADALVELCRCVLREGRAPTVGGARPQVALVLPAPSAAPAAGGARPWLEWLGELPAAVAERIACDADVWRAVLDPATSQPLNVGRAHRLVPYWLRKALWVRDRGCRFPGCHAPPAWCDGHHLQPWARGGRTDLVNLLLLCRWHHGLVHEGCWGIRYDTTTNTVTATRPDGSPYEIRGRPPAIGPPSTMDEAA
jgi:hypothetical protein